MPEISVIIATYRSPDTLHFTLASVLRQTFTDFEVWVVGDGCTDHTADVVAAFGDPRLHWVNLPQNTGSQSEPNNEGLRRATGRCIAYIGHDDLWFPHHLETLLHALDETQADMVHSLTPMMGAERAERMWGAMSDGETYQDARIPPSSWLMQHTSAQRAGPWMPPASIGWHIDLDVLRRVARSGARIIAVPRVTLLKFPSQIFAPYRTGAPRPQIAYDELMRADPAALELRIATELAVVGHRTHLALGARAMAVIYRLRAGLRRASQDFSEAVPLFEWFAVMLQRRHRRMIRSRRGLDSRR